jgi:hypothetical protein
VHSPSHCVYGPLLSFSISHLRMSKTSRLYKIRFVISDALNSQACELPEIKQPSTNLNLAA